jgi:hypothetical protein
MNTGGLQVAMMEFIISNDSFERGTGHFDKRHNLFTLMQ